MATVRQLDAEPSLLTASDRARLDIKGPFAQQEKDDQRAGRVLKLISDTVGESGNQLTLSDAGPSNTWNSETAGVITKVMTNHWRFSQEETDMNDGESGCEDLNDDESDSEEEPNVEVVCEMSLQPSIVPIRAPRDALLVRPSFLPDGKKAGKFRRVSTDSNFGLSDRQLRAASTADDRIFRQQLDSDHHSHHSERDSNYGLSDVQLQMTVLAASVEDEAAAEPEQFSHVGSDPPQRAAQDSNFGLSDRQLLAASMVEANVFRLELDSDQHSHRSERDSSYGLSDGQLTSLALPPMCCLYEEECLDSYSAITPSLPIEEMTDVLAASESGEPAEEVMELNYDAGVQVVLSQSFHGDQGDLQGGGCPSTHLIPSVISDKISPTIFPRHSEKETEKKRNPISEEKPLSNKQQVLSTQVVPRRATGGFMSRWRLCLCAPAHGSSGKVSF